MSLVKKILVLGMVASLVLVVAITATISLMAAKVTEAPMLVSLTILAEVVISAFVFILIAELFARSKEKATEVDGVNAPPDRMEPHIFCHFVPSNSFADVTNNFRNGAQAIGGDGTNTIYLAGDCTVFEDHLPVEQTMGSILGGRMDGFNVLNAGAAHYTILHCYNRLIYDLVRGYRPNIVMVLTGANDVLSFVHHKNGNADPAHTHFYKPWLDVEAALSQVDKYALSLANLFVRRAHYKDQKSWDRRAEDLTENFWDDVSIVSAKNIFSTEPFSMCLLQFKAVCNAVGAQLVLSTFAYNDEDMTGTARQFYAEGIDALNELIRIFARENNLTIVDFAKNLDLQSGGDISNKWHFSKNGNIKRAELISKVMHRSIS